VFYFLTVQFSRINFFLLFSTSFKVNRDIFYHHSFYLSSTFFHFFISFFVLVCNFLLDSHKNLLYSFLTDCQVFFLLFLKLFICLSFSARTFYTIPHSFINCNTFFSFFSIFFKIPIYNLHNMLYNWCVIF